MATTHRSDDDSEQTVVEALFDAAVATVAERDAVLLDLLSR